MTPRRIGLALVLLALGCSETPPPSSGTSAAVSSPDETAREREAKRSWREPGTTEVAEIDWAEASTLPRADVSMLPAQAREEIDRATLPVLLPRDATLLAGAVITRGEHWYSASLHPDGHHITIHGTSQSVVRPEIEEELRAAGRLRAPGEPAVTRTDGIVTVDFLAFGASYTVDVECARPSDDTRCTEDAYALSVFEGLGLAGGAQ